MEAPKAPDEKKNRMAACPESTIESAPNSGRIFVRKPAPSNDQFVDNNNQVSEGAGQFACGSTVQSAARRNFIQKAALATAAVGLGTSVFGGNILKTSSARSDKPNCTNCICCTFNLRGSICVTNGPYDTGLCGNCCGDHRRTIIVRNAKTCNTARGVASFVETSLYLRCNSFCIPSGPASPVGVLGYADKGLGLYGRSSSSYGVEGISGSGTGVFGCSACNTGVYGKGKQYGLQGCSSPSGTGVHGISGSGPGVFGVSTTRYGVHGCSPCNVGVYGTGKVHGVQGCSPCGAGVYGVGEVYGVQGCALCVTGRHVGVVGNTGSGAGSAGVAGYALGGCCARFPNVTTGVYGESHAFGGQGVSGLANPVAGCGAGIGVMGQSNGLCGIGVLGVAGTACTVPIAAKGAPGQFANLQQWENSSNTPLSIVNKCGWLGVGAANAPTTLAVNGSMSAKTVIAATNYKMGASDFAVLAGGAITVTLPEASTAAGMMVFIKNTSTSTVTVKAFNKAAETDTIEGSATKHLKKQYDSLQLISNGTDEWFILGNSICAAFTS
jgi:hypothetical protein